MRYLVLAVGMGIILALAIPTAQAAVIVTEGFDSYAANSALVGSGSADSTWAGGWTAINGTDTDAIVAGGLYYNNGGVTVGSADLSGNSARMVDSDNVYGNVRRTLATTVLYSTTPEIYVSYLIQSSNVITRNDQSAFIGLYSSRDATHDLGIRANAGIYPNSSSPAVNPWGDLLQASTSGSTKMNGGPTVVAGTTYMVVTRLWHDPNVAIQPNGYNRQDMWINPDGTDNASTFDATSVATVAGGAINMLYGPNIYTNAGWTATDYQYIDNWVMGTTWGDVVTPEPATMTLLALGGLGMLIRRKRTAR
jgi:hypothetical protein